MQNRNKHNTVNALAEFYRYIVYLEWREWFDYD